MADPPSDHDWYEKSHRAQSQQINSVLVERIDFLRGDLRRIEEKIDRWEAKLAQIERDVADRYITSDEFLPVKLIAYGFVAAIGLGFLGLLFHTIGWKP